MTETSAAPTKPQPIDIMAMCSETSGGLMLRRIAGFYPRYRTREELMVEGGISIQSLGSVCAYAAFQFRIEEMRTMLRPLGWTVERAPPKGNPWGIFEKYRLMELP